MIDKFHKKILLDGLKFTGLDESLMDDIFCYLWNNGKTDIQEIYDFYKINPKNINSKGVKEIMTLVYLDKVSVKDGIYEVSDEFVEEFWKLQ